jgi:hypothetical protein
MTFDEIINELEMKELDQFAIRREMFGGSLEIMNVHNVPQLFPNIYKALYGKAIRKGLFDRPYYGDYDKQKARVFEKYLNNQDS